jgi:hypothetical protein
MVRATEFDRPSGRILVGYLQKPKLQSLLQQLALSFPQLAPAGLQQTPLVQAGPAGIPQQVVLALQPD